jgi:hypothetical protein
MFQRPVRMSSNSIHSVSVRGWDVFDDRVAKGLEYGLLVGGDDEVFGSEPVFAGVHRGDGLAGFGARASGELGVGLIGDVDRGRDELLVTAFFGHCENSSGGGYRSVAPTTPVLYDEGTKNEG